MDTNQLLIDTLNGLRSDVQELTKAVHAMELRLQTTNSDVVGLSSRLVRMEDWRKEAQHELKKLEGVSAVIAELKKRVVQMIGAGLLALLVALLQMAGVVKFPLIGATPPSTVSLTVPTPDGTATTTVTKSGTGR